MPAPTTAAGATNCDLPGASDGTALARSQCGSPRRDQVLHLLQRARVLDRRQVARITPLAHGLLPKTRSGKLLRRAIQAVCEGRDPGDLTTIEDPGALQQVKDLVAPG